MRGELGFPADGFPPELQAKVLKGKPPLVGRPGESIEPVDLAAAKAEAEKALGIELSEQNLASYLMYPKVFKEFSEHQKLYGDVSTLPSPVFFYGLPEQQEEISVDIEPGKTLVIRLQSRTDVEDEGVSKLFFELNGQSRMIRVPHAGAAKSASARARAEDGNANQIGAPMPGMVVRVAVQKGQTVAKGEPLMALEAMKMETVIAAPREAVVKHIHAGPGVTVNTKDLLIEFES
jgi:pyruvate carboxylase